MTDTAREVSWVGVELSILLLTLATPFLVNVAEAGNVEIVKGMTQAAVMLVFAFSGLHMIKYNTTLKENVQRLYEAIV